MKNDRNGTDETVASAQRAREIGSIKFIVTRHEYTPLYENVGGATTIGEALDYNIRRFYANNAVVAGDSLLTSLSFELGDEAAAALRDRCNRGEY